jgi:hypothetical protein
MNYFSRELFVNLFVVQNTACFRAPIIMAVDDLPVAYKFSEFRFKRFAALFAKDAPKD